MNIRIGAILIILVVVIAGCEEPQEIKCYPQSITTKGDGGATSITADFKYFGDTLDRIVWSNYQTHFYFYDQAGLLSKVSRINVQTFRKMESELIYEDGLEVRRDEYQMNLNRTTQVDIDTSLIGYIEFEYSGQNVIAEKEFSKDEQSEAWGVKSYKEYEYDLKGNIIKYALFDDVGGDTIEAYTYKYDLQKHPFSSIKTLFEGQSTVNNIIETSDLLSDDVYVHSMGYTITNFPEQIVKKQGSINLEIISISYTCN